MEFTIEQRMPMHEAMVAIARDKSAKLTCPICQQGTLLIDEMPYPGYHPSLRVHCSACQNQGTLTGARLPET